MKKLKRHYLLQNLNGTWWVTKFVEIGEPYELIKKLEASWEKQAEKEAIKYLESK